MCWLCKRRPPAVVDSTPEMTFVPEEFKVKEKAKKRKSRQESGPGLVMRTYNMLAEKLDPILPRASFRTNVARNFLLLLLCYMCGFWGWGVVFPIVFLLQWLHMLVRPRQLEQKRADIDFMHLAHDPKMLQKLLQRNIPLWVSFPDVQNINWLNEVFTGMWPSVKRATEAVLLPSLQKILDERVTVVSKLEITKLDLGSVPPKFSGLRFRRSAQSAVWDLNMKLIGNTDIRINAKSGKFPVGLPAGIANVALSGTLRVAFTNITTTFPCFDFICISFTEKPRMNFDLKAIKLPLTAIPGLKSYLPKLLENIVKWTFVWPKKAVVQIGYDVNPQLYEYLSDSIARGVVYVQVFQLKNAPMKAACTISLDEQVQTTEYVTNSSDPQWFGQVKEFLVHDPCTESIQIEVRKRSFTQLGSSSKGEVTVPLWSLFKGDAVFDFGFSLKPEEMQKKIDLVRGGSSPGVAAVTAPSRSEGPTLERKTSVFSAAGMPPDTHQPQRGAVRPKAAPPTGPEVLPPGAKRRVLMLPLDKAQKGDLLFEVTYVPFLKIPRPVERLGVDGLLYITVEEGKDLVAKDSSTSDAFFKVLVQNRGQKPGDAEEIHKSWTCPKTVNPKWWDECSVRIRPGMENILIRVYDHDTFSRDDFMGHLHIPIAEICASDQCRMKGEFKLANTKRGWLKIELQLLLLPTSELRDITREHEDVFARSREQAGPSLELGMPDVKLGLHRRRTNEAKQAELLVSNDPTDMFGDTRQPIEDVNIVEVKSA